MRERKSVDSGFREVLRGRAREMRKTMSPAEGKLWSRPRRVQLFGLRFRRQHLIGPFVVDYFCPRMNLVVEVDGDSHYEPGQEDCDRDRTAYFIEIGLREVRFTNVEVFSNIDGVLSAIARAANLVV